MKPVLKLALNMSGDG